MSLRIVYGRAGSGKTRIFYEEIKSAEKNNEPIFLLVPEQFTFQAERDLITFMKTGGLLKSEVLSFRRLAYRVFNEVGGITYPHIHPSGKSMIIYRILDKLKNNFSYFKGAAERQGFVNTISTLIKELKRYNINPIDLEETCKNINDNTELQEKLNELASIYKEFGSTLVKRYRDTDDELKTAANKLSQTTLFDSAEVWIDGFDGFTPQEFEIIKELLCKVKRVNISLCTDYLIDEKVHQGIDIYAQVKASYKKLNFIAKECGIEIETPLRLDTKPLYRFNNKPELAHLEENFNLYPYKIYSNQTTSISLFSSTNIFTEIEAAARDIIRLCRDDGMRFREICVVTRNIEDYEKLIEVVFSEHEIPYFMDTKSEITKHPIVRLLLSTLDIFNENWSYEAVFRYLKTGMTGILEEDIDMLENYVLACGIRGSKWTDGKDWKYNPDFILSEDNFEMEKQEYLKKINFVKEAVVLPLQEFRNKTKGRHKATAYCMELFELFCKLGVPSRIEKYIEDFKLSGNINLANEYSRVWNIIMEVFDQTVEVMGDENIGIERFSNILAIGLSEYKIGVIPASIDQILVGSIEHSKNNGAKALFILGANDGVFPKAAIEEGILTDKDRAVLKNNGVELASDTKTQAFDEQFLVYRALTSASEYLRLSWSIADQEGKTLRPSMIISRLRKIFPQIQEFSNISKNNSIDGQLEMIASKSSAFRQMAAQFRQKADGKDIHSTWTEVYKYFSSKDEWKKNLTQMKAAFEYKNLVNQVSKEKVKKLYGEPSTASVSRLEKFSACPFAFFVQYGLNAKERKIFKLKPPDVGTFMHEVIERFSKIVDNGEGKYNADLNSGQEKPMVIAEDGFVNYSVLTWRTFDRAWCETTVSEIVEEMLNSMKNSGITASKRYTSIIKRLKRVIVRAIWLIAEHIRQSSFNPIDYEVGFGDREKYPPIIIELDSGEKIHLTGRIDRVDGMKTEKGEYLRIVDYKSGAKDFKLSDLYYGLQIQLITYLDALWTEENQRFPAGMLYFKIDDPIIKKNGIIDDEAIELEIKKQLKMKGLLLADVKLIREMDKGISGASNIIPATINKDETLGKNSSVASMDQFKMLRKYTRTLLKELCAEIINGNVDIKPYKKKGSKACDFCSFHSVCRFDQSLKENSFRVLWDKSNDEIWDLMNI